MIDCNAIVTRGVLCDGRAMGRLCTAVDVWPRRGRMGRVLQDSGVLEGVLQYGFFYGGEDEPDIRCVGGLCETVERSALPLRQRAWYILRVQIEMRPIDLVEPPEQVFGGAVYVVAPRIVGEVVAQRRTS